MWSYGFKFWEILLPLKEPLEEACFVNPSMLANDCLQIFPEASWPLLFLSVRDVHYMMRFWNCLVIIDHSYSMGDLDKGFERIFCISSYGCHHISALNFATIYYVKHIMFDFHFLDSLIWLPEA